MLNNHDRVSGNNKEGLEPSRQMEILVAQLREQVAALERENLSLQAELDACQRSQESQARIAELEKAYAVLQAEMREHHRCEIALAHALAQQAVLANQATLAVQFTRLTEEAKQTVSAREQEQAALERAAKLAKANEALQASLSKLADEPELGKFLGHVLRVCAERLGAVGAGIWHFEAEIGYLIASYEDGKVKLPPETPHPGAVRAIAKRANINSKSEYIGLTKREIRSDHEEDFQNRPDYEPYRAYLRQRGIKSIISVPMFLGESLRGSLTLRFDHRRMLKSEEAELAHALANQATLALELTRLAEEAKQSAIAREQEKAAKERVAQLARANTILKKTIDVLATEPDLDRSLSHVLQVTTEHLDSPSTALWLANPGGDTFSLHLVYLNGSIIPATPENADQLSGEWIRGRDLSRDLTLKTHIRNCAPTIYDIACCPEITPPQRQFMKRLGVKTLLGIPLLLGTKIVGSFTVRFTEQREFSAEELELIQALAHQATLVIQLQQLANEAKQTALLEERNRLAGEIHDTLAQAFTGITIQLKVAKRIAHQDPAEMQKILARTSLLAEAGLAEARRSVWALYPAAAEYSNLAQSLPSCIEQLANNSNAHIKVSIQGTPYALASIVGMNLLRIGQEAVLNALKHAQAETIWVELIFEPTSVCLRIWDDGHGFILPTDDSSVSGGFGLISINQRAERIGGQLTITTELGRGTEILVQVRN